MAMITHIDDLVGVLIETLQGVGQLENTYVIITSDHGEMLGERSMWCKFNPYEASVRVRFIMQGPGVRAGHREEALASLVDLLPTLTEIASDGGFDGYAAPVDGRSLLHLPQPDSPEDRVFLEFTGEGFYARALIVLKGRYKLVYSRPDPKMLFDLRKDLQELTNLATDPADADVLADLVAEMEARWDEDDLNRRIRASQDDRLFVQQVMKHGRFPYWDHGPPDDPSKFHVRGGTDPSTTVPKQQGRFPYMPFKPPQRPHARKG